MQFPWTVILEVDDGKVEAENVLAHPTPQEAIAQVQRDFRHARVLGVIKGSHAGSVYGHQEVSKAPHKDQLKIPFGKEGHNL